MKQTLSDEGRGLMRNGSFMRELMDGADEETREGNFCHLPGLFSALPERDQGNDLPKTALAVWLHAFDAVNDIVTIQDEGMRIIGANKTACQFFRAQDNDLIGMFCYELFSGKSEPCPICPLCSDSGARTSNSVIFHEKLGKIFQVSSAAVPLDHETYIVHIARDITQYREAENALQESEGRFAKAFDANPAPMVISEIDTGLFIDVNRKWSEMLGYTREELIGKTSVALGIWELPEERERMVAEFSAKGCVKEFPVTYRTKSGGARSVLRSAERITLHGREVMLSLVYDFTERQKVERTLRESEEKFAVAFDASPDAVNINRLDDGLYVEINKGFTQLTGFTQSDVCGKTSSDINIWHNPADRERLVRELREKGYCENLEACFCRKDGGLITALMSARTISLNNVSHIVSITRDIGKLKQAERENIAQKQLFETMFNAIHDAVIIVDSDDCIQLVNKGMETTFGYFPDDLLGKSLSVLNADHDREVAMHPPLLQENLGRRRQLRVMTYRHASGTEFPGETFGSKLYDQENRFIGKLLVIRDITDRILLESQLQQAQKMESLGRLTGGVAHDFNNILGVIVGYAELGLMKVDSSHILHDDLEKILDAGRRSANIVRQLLAFSRQQPIQPVALDLNSTVEEMLKILHRLIGEDIDIVWIPQPGLPLIKMDPSQMDQILANLCINAKDAINGAGRITIETAMVCCDETCGADHVGYGSGEFVQLAVSDTGCGIKKGDLKKVFEPFFTTKEMGQGTGLGLSTVYGIVKQNQGFIHACSEPGTGTTFTLYFPPCSNAGVTAEPMRWEEFRAGNGETILLVEDDPALLAMSGKMLMQLGYHVLTAGSPGQALSLAKDHPGDIDLLMTDVVLPGMNGKELARSLQSENRTLQCLFTSGYTASVIEPSGVFDQGIHFIQKPYSIPKLAWKILEVFNDRRDGT